MFLFQMKLSKKGTAFDAITPVDADSAIHAKQMVYLEQYIYHIVPKEGDFGNTKKNLELLSKGASTDKEALAYALVKFMGIHEKVGDEKRHQLNHVSGLFEIGLKKAAAAKIPNAQKAFDLYRRLIDDPSRDEPIQMVVLDRRNDIEGALLDKNRDGTYSLIVGVIAEKPFEVFFRQKDNGIEIIRITPYDKDAAEAEGIKQMLFDFSKPKSREEEETRWGYSNFQYLMDLLGNAMQKAKKEKLKNSADADASFLRIYVGFSSEDASLFYLRPKDKTALITDKKNGFFSITLENEFEITFKASGKGLQVTQISKLE